MTFYPRSARRSALVLAFVLLPVALAPATTFASGFSIFEQGAKASGLAGAYVALADDASANW